MSRLAWGSMSTISTLLPPAANRYPRFATTDVLKVPPLWFHTAMVRSNGDRSMGLVMPCTVKLLPAFWEVDTPSIGKHAIELAIQP